LSVVQFDDQPSIFVAFSDSSNSFLAEYSVPDLELIRTTSLNLGTGSGDMLSFQWELEEETISTLMLVDSRRRTLFYNAETLDRMYFGYNTLMPVNYVRSVVTESENDETLNLVVLSRDWLICYSDNPVVVSEDNHFLNPTSLTLSEPYPNPFNSNVNIEYQIPIAAKVSLILYDLQGKQVAEVVNTMHSAGTQTIIYQAQELATGCT